MDNALTHREKIKKSRPGTTNVSIERHRWRMNTHLTEIAFILDRSGSMHSIATDAIGGFNSFLSHQQRSAGQANLTLVLFDDECLIPADNVEISHVAPLNEETYIPRSSTALLDAIGMTIDRIGERLSSTAEAERPGKVIVAILTDGLENASTRFDWDDISRRIRHQTDVYNWEFLFLGANQDAIATAASLNIRTGNSTNFCSIDKAAMAVSRKAAALRAKTSGAEMNYFESKALESDLSFIYEEEARRSSDDEL